MKLFILTIMTIFASISEANDIATLVEKNNSWLKLTNDCPADIMGKKVATTTYNPELCESNISKCFIECRKGDVNFCYNLAQTLQAQKHIETSEVLFVKACELGSVSACTNRAAGIQKELGEKSLPCTVRTYEMGCKHDDPWSCTMFGFHLATGNGIEKNLQRSLEVFKKSCKYGPVDEACQRATTFTEQVKQLLNK